MNVEHRFETCRPFCETVLTKKKYIAPAAITRTERYLGTAHLAQKRYACAPGMPPVWKKSVDSTGNKQTQHVIMRRNKRVGDVSSTNLQQAYRPIQISAYVKLSEILRSCACEERCISTLVYNIMRQSHNLLWKACLEPWKPTALNHEPLNRRAQNPRTKTVGPQQP